MVDRIFTVIDSRNFRYLKKGHRFDIMHCRICVKSRYWIMTKRLIWAVTKITRYLLYIGNEVLPSYTGIIGLISQAMNSGSRLEPIRISWAVIWCIFWQQIHLPFGEESWLEQQNKHQRRGGGTNLKNSNNNNNNNNNNHNNNNHNHNHNHNKSWDVVVCVDKDIFNNNIY